MARVRQPWQDRIVVSDDQLCWELRIDGCVSIAHQRHVQPKADRPTTGRVDAELGLHAGNDKVSHTKSPQFIQEWGLVKGI